MARRVKTAVEAVTVNPEKIVRGLTTVFQGFSIMFDGMAEQMQLMQGMTDKLCVSEDMQKKETKDKEEGSVKDGTPVDAGTSSEISKKSEEKSQKPEEAQKPKVEEAEQSEELPWDTKPEATPKEVSAEAKKETASTAITADDIREVVVAKIKQNRKNNEQIGKLLSAYGVKLLSDLPEEKYESFLNDISQL